MDLEEKVHNVPVPERFLPIVFNALAEAYRGEASGGLSGVSTPVQPPADDTVLGWTKAEVMSVYHESTQSLRVTLDYLADRAGQEVWSRELASAVYPKDGEAEAESRLYGVLGAFGSRVINKYGK